MSVRNTPDGTDRGLFYGTCARHSSLQRQAAFSLKSKYAKACTIAKRERTDNQNTLYLGFEQQIIPGHLSYGIQVRTDVSCIPHSHLWEGVFLGQERIALLSHVSELLSQAARREISLFCILEIKIFIFKVQ